MRSTLWNFSLLGKPVFIVVTLVLLAFDAGAQCPTASGDEVSYGSGSWIGYVYDGASNFTSGNYQGYITETENFNETFCGNNCDFTTAGCDVTTETFTVRFKMTQTYTCGNYTITVGGDDGYRLSIDGGATWIVDEWFVQPYASVTQDIYLDGTYNMVLEFYEQNGENRVSFNIAAAGGTASGGSIGADQSLCGAVSSDPDEIVSLVEGGICGETISYQWYSSTDNITFSAIAGATSNTYDPPSGLSTTTWYFRQTVGTSNYNSDTTQVTFSVPPGDETTYGVGSWIGYAYDSLNFNSTAYLGFITESANFNETFCGAYCDASISGCDLYTQTFQIRFKMQETYTCGEYEITIGGDDGVRFSLDGGATWVIDDWSNHGYRESSYTTILDGTYDMVLEYYENGGSNRVSFNINGTPNQINAGEIGTDQYFCETTADPAILTSVSDGVSCNGVVNYQWFSSTDNVTFSPVAGATSSTYDPPAGLTDTIYYFRRLSDGVNLDSSNLVTIIVATPMGDEVTYGAGSWIGYVYDGRNNYATADYLGYMTETEEFDESFCGNACDYSINGCDVYTETFSVRFRMQQTFACDMYELRIGGDDGVRLSIDGGATWLISDFGNHGFRRTTESVFLDGTYDMVFEYFENGGGNRVSFDYTALGVVSDGGEISGDQDYCSNTVDPAEFTSTVDAFSCAGASTYQWFSSADGATWSAISGATSNTYDPPAGVTDTTYYFRQSFDGTNRDSSNVVAVNTGAAQGDQESFGSDSWLAYAYNSTAAFGSVDYVGYFTEPHMFDESFCGANCTFSLNGCNLNTQTFSVRFKMAMTIVEDEDITFTVGADDGVRLSIDSGATYLINDWSNHGYRTSSATATLTTGTYYLILEYYEDGGGNRISFSRSGNVLAVDLASFEVALTQEQTVNVLWATETETENNYFEVERSPDGVVWHSLSTIQGAGNSSEALFYQFEDENPLPGQSYYRLKQVDFDGTSEYSEVRSIQLQNAQTDVSVYPNPASQFIWINDVSIDPESVVFDMAGRNLSHAVSVNAQGNVSRIMLSQLPEGTYVIRTSEEDKLVTVIR